MHGSNEQAEPNLHIDNSGGGRAAVDKVAFSGLADEKESIFGVAGNAEINR